MTFVEKFTKWADERSLSYGIENAQAYCDVINLEALKATIAARAPRHQAWSLPHDDTLTDLTQWATTPAHTSLEGNY